MPINPIIPHKLLLEWYREHPLYGIIVTLLLIIGAIVLTYLEHKGKGDDN